METLDRRYRWFKITLWDENREDIDYIFRGLTANEMRLLDTKPDDDAKDLYVLTQVVTPLKDWDNFPYQCVPLRIISEIYMISGITEEAIPQRGAIDWISSPQGGMEAIAINFVAGLDFPTLRNADPSDYWKYLMSGKQMYETLFAGKAEEVFTPQGSPIDDGIRGPDPMPPLRPGEKGIRVDGGFNFRKR